MGQLRMRAGSRSKTRSGLYEWARTVVSMETDQLLHCASSLTPCSSSLGPGSGRACILMTPFRFALLLTGHSRWWSLLLFVLWCENQSDTVCELWRCPVPVCVWQTSTERRVGDSVRLCTVEDDGLEGARRSAAAVLRDAPTAALRSWSRWRRSGLCQNIWRCAPNRRGGPSDSSRARFVRFPTFSL